MIIIDLMLIMLFIITIISLSGRKRMSNTRGIQIICTIATTYSIFLNLIEGYKLGEITISWIIGVIAIILAIFIVFCTFSKIFLFSTSNPSVWNRIFLKSSIFL